MATAIRTLRKIMAMRKSGIFAALLVILSIAPGFAQDKIDAPVSGSSGSPTQGFKETAVQVGHGFRTTAIEIGKKGVEVGHAFRDAAIHVGHAFRDSFRQVGQSFRSSGDSSRTAAVADATPTTTIATATQITATPSAK
jgi:hypothetical protein